MQRNGRKEQGRPLDPSNGETDKNNDNSLVGFSNKMGEAFFIKKEEGASPGSVVKTVLSMQ